MYFSKKYRLISFVLSLVTLGLLSGCGLFLLGSALDHEPSTVTYEYEAFDASKLVPDIAQCEKSDEIETGRVVQEDEITLRREYQRVVRLGCEPDGTQSDSIANSADWEQVVSPRRFYIIRPKNIKPSDVPATEGDWYAGIKGVARNKSTCTSGFDWSRDNLPKEFIDILLNSVDLESQDQVRTKIEEAYGTIAAGPHMIVVTDLDANFLNLNMKEGENVIEYEFTGPCKDKDSEDCDFEGRRVLEKGVVVLNVIYELRDKGVIKKIKY
ncbi:MAG: hypothetical protein AAF203_04480, partial [Pseudomonadota bacterium]